MAASDEQIERLRRMVAEPESTTYSDSSLAAYIESYQLIDALGLEPDDAGWTPTYDLAAAAGDVWAEKAAALGGQYDFSADGFDGKRSQVKEHAEKQARYWRSRRVPTSMRLHVSHDFERDYQATPESVLGIGAAQTWVANSAADEDDE